MRQLREFIDRSKATRPGHRMPLLSALGLHERFLLDEVYPHFPELVQKVAATLAFYHARRPPEYNARERGLPLAEMKAAHACREMGLWAGLAPLVVAAATAPDAAVQDRVSKVFAELPARKDFDGIGGPTTVKCLLISLQLLFPSVDVCLGRCPVGDGAEPGLRRIFGGVAVRRGGWAEQQRLRTVTELVGRQLGG
eukprot:gene6469-19306_t